MTRPVVQLPPKRAALALLALPMLILTGCSDSLISAAPSPPSYSASAKNLPTTLTPEQRKAAIADLQSEQARRQGATDDTATASVKPAPAQN